MDSDHPPPANDGPDHPPPANDGSDHPPPANDGSDHPPPTNDDSVTTIQDNAIENTDQDTVTGESSNSTNNQVWQGVDCGLYKPMCAPGLTPVVGMCFPDLLSGINFYRTYAATCGFVSRLGTQKSSRHRVSVTLKYVVCAKQGETSVKPSSESGPHDDVGKQAIKRRRCASTRTGCEAMISLKLKSGNRYVISKFIEHHNHPFFTDYDKKSRSSRNLSRARVPPQTAPGGPRETPKSPASGMQQKTDAHQIDIQIWSTLSSILSNPKTTYADRVALLESIKGKFCKKGGHHDAQSCEERKRDEAILQSHSTKGGDDRANT